VNVSLGVYGNLLFVSVEATAAKIDHPGAPARQAAGLDARRSPGRPLSDRPG
jgi:hypothetical protein